MKPATGLTRYRRVVVLALSAALSACATAPTQLNGTLDIQGHRGFRGLYPENTMAGFRAALELQVTTIELDLQITRDGVLVAHHDSSLNSTLCVHDDGRPVEKLRLSQVDFTFLADIDCGSRPNRKFPEQRSVPGERIPQLDEVLKLAEQADYPVHWNIEIKMDDSRRRRTVEEIAALVVESVRAAGLGERTIIQSFDPEVLAVVAELAPEMGRAILTKSPSDFGLQVRNSRATILSTAYDVLSIAIIERYQRRGVAVIPWTVNTPEEMRKLIVAGVDGIISDYPDRVMMVLDEISKESSLVEQRQP